MLNGWSLKYHGPVGNPYLRETWDAPPAQSQWELCFFFGDSRISNPESHGILGGDPPLHIPTPSPNVQVTNAQVLNHEMVEVLGLKIWGAGWHPRRGDSKSGNNYTDVPKEVAGITWDCRDWERFWKKGVPGGVGIWKFFCLAVVKYVPGPNLFFFQVRA